MQFRTRYACILLLKCHAASWAHKQWGGGRFIQSKAKNDVDAGRDRATPTSVRLDADEEVDSRGAMCTLDYRVATNRHGSHTIKCGTPTPKYLPPKWTGVVGLAAGCFSIRVEITKTTIGNRM